MRTTEREIGNHGLVPDGRFTKAGELLALSRIVLLGKADGEEEHRNSTLLRVLAEKVAEYGVDFARGFADGAYYVKGSVESETWDAIREILGDAP
jgi:hypothetical protein